MLGYASADTLTLISCDRCGEYLISMGEMSWLPGDLRAFLSCAVRQSWETGERLAVTLENAAHLAHEHAYPGVTANREKLLRFAAKRCSRPGRKGRLYPQLDFTVIDATGDEELQSYLMWLKEDGLLRVDHNTTTIWTFELTFEGWNSAQPGPQVGGIPGTCFVGMWFDASMTEAFELGILPAIETDCGFKALRIDRKEHNNQITDEIMAGIRSTEFMVADFTGHRAGVYYEAGFARGLGRKVIYCCREDSFKGRHFDTSVINHVVWTDPGDLRKRLAERIKATILPKA